MAQGDFHDGKGTRLVQVHSREKTRSGDVGRGERKNGQEAARAVSERQTSRCRPLCWSALKLAACAAKP